MSKSVTVQGMPTAGGCLPWERLHSNGMERWKSGHVGFGIDEWELRRWRRCAEVGLEICIGEVLELRSIGSHLILTLTPREGGPL